MGELTEVPGRTCQPRLAPAGVCTAGWPRGFFLPHPHMAGYCHVTGRQNHKQRTEYLLPYMPHELRTHTVTEALIQNYPEMESSTAR